RLAELGRGQLRFERFQAVGAVAVDDAFGGEEDAGDDAVQVAALDHGGAGARPLALDASQVKVAAGGAVLGGDFVDGEPGIEDRAEGRPAPVPTAEVFGHALASGVRSEAPVHEPPL